MVQRKDPSKLGIQADHVKSDKHLENLKVCSSQNQEGKCRGTERNSKLKKSKSMKLSDLEAIQSPPSQRSLYQPGIPTPLHVATALPCTQQQNKPLLRTTDMSLSPNYMKPTSSWDAKKELFPVSLRDAQSSSDGKKTCSFPSKKPPETLNRSSSLNLVRTLAETPSFKPSRACPRKPTTAVVCADVNAPDRPTCSSTLKHSKFPQYLMLNQSEGASIMKVCPYTYCSLSCHCHALLPPLKSFMSARKHIVMTRKSMKTEAVGPRRVKVPCETSNDSVSDIELNAFDRKPAYDADMVNPVITTLAPQNGADFFVEIYAMEKQGADETGKFETVKDLEDQEDIKPSVEENDIAAGEDGVNVKHVPSMLDGLPMSEINLEEDFKKYYDDFAIEADTKGSFHPQPNAEDEDENHEDVCKVSYCSEVSHDGEHMENIELDGFESQETDIEWHEEQYCVLDHEEGIDSCVFTEEKTDLKFESLPERVHDVSEMSLDDILGSIPDEEALIESNEEESTSSEPRATNSVLEGTYESFETQETEYLSNSTSCDQSFPTDEEFQHLTKAEDNDKETEKHVDDEANCATKVENSEGYPMNEACETEVKKEDSNSSPENSDESMSQEEQQLLEEDEMKANKFQNTSFKSWQRATMQEDEEMRKINSRKPNLLTFVPDPEPEKVHLKHQMMDERKNAEEWMLDFALRQAVTKLAPAGKRKVALLVEAFETVMKCETHFTSNSSFANARPIQACS